MRLTLLEREALVRLRAELDQPDDEGLVMVERRDLVMLVELCDRVVLEAMTEQAECLPL